MESKDSTLYFKGAWVTAQLTTQVVDKLADFQSDTANDISTVNFSELQHLDTNGASLIQDYLQQQETQHSALTIEYLPEAFQCLLRLVKEKEAELEEPNTEESLPMLANVGKKTELFYKELLTFISFIGEISVVMLHWLTHPHKIRWRAIWNSIDSTGYKAIPIVALLSFLIGVVLCYQMGIQLQTYGASIYVVDLLGLSILREFGPLITAIIIAGRTGSAFAAQIGTMKLNQEIDALNTFGVSPTEQLVLPKLTALVIALPLLSILSIITGIMGGMYMANILFGINYADFLSRFGSVVQVKTLILGMIKTPVFAVFIAAVGCFQGFKVEGNAASVGEHTTIAVVQSIFMIIVIDAIFSIIYSKMGL